MSHDRECNTPLPSTWGSGSTRISEIRSQPCNLFPEGSKYSIFTFICLSEF